MSKQVVATVTGTEELEIEEGVSRLECDVAVLGGGLAGVCAAIAAARTGASVVLVNNRPVLGGASSSEIRVWVCGATAHGGQKFARETGIIGELLTENQYRNRDGNPYFWDQVVLDFVRSEKNIRLLLNTDVRSVQVEDAKIQSVRAWQTGSEKIFELRAKEFVDTTGDGFVGHKAGATYEIGRESKDAFGEEWGQLGADDVTLGSTMLFYVKECDHPVEYVAPSIAIPMGNVPRVLERVKDPRQSGCFYWWIEYGGELDVTADNEAIRDQLWGVIFGIWDVVKNSGRYQDVENLTLEWVGSVPGKREYRRIIGDYVVTQHDVMEQREFADQVGFGGWSIDLHAPKGVFDPGTPAKNLFGPGVYNIPFRSLYSRDISNLLMAGRDVSASHVALGTLRVMATCAVAGEAAGTGAALAARLSCDPRELVTHHLSSLQDQLLENDASVIGVEWRNKADLALEATVATSSTLTSLNMPEPRPDDEEIPLTNDDLALLLPIEGQLDSSKVYLSAPEGTAIRVEAWDTGNGYTHIPVRLLDSGTVTTKTHGRQWVPLPLEPRKFDGELAIILRRADGLSLPYTVSRAPYGVLGMVSRIPRVKRTDDGPQTNTWDASPLRDRSFGFEMTGQNDCYSPRHLLGGYQRPYNGPQLWSSAEMTDEEQEECITLTWDEPKSVGRVDVIFNDNVDRDLINLHHHFTPDPVAPELVRSYSIDGLVGEEWMELTNVSDNRKRRRQHPLDLPDCHALRVRIRATHGYQWGTVTAVRVFASPDQSAGSHAAIATK